MNLPIIPNEPRIVDVETWRKAEDKNDLGIKKACIHDDLPEVVKEVDGEKVDRTIAWTVSREERDRDRDRIQVRGWALGPFRRNPVTLWAHNHGAPPIGQSLKIWKDNNAGQPRLRSLIKFTDQDENAFGYMIYRMVLGRYLRAASVGFLPIKWDKDPEEPEDLPDWRKGNLFKQQELLEHSIVPVPSQRESLAEARSFGIDLTPYVEWSEQILDSGESLFLPRKTVEEVYQMAKGSKPLVFTAKNVTFVCDSSEKENEDANETEEGNTVDPANTADDSSEEKEAPMVLSAETDLETLIELRDEIDGYIKEAEANDDIERVSIDPDLFKNTVREMFGGNTNA